VLSVEDFDNILVLQKNPQNVNNDLNKSYNLLANRSRVAKIFSSKINPNNLEINKMNNSGNVIDTRCKNKF
jgi:hypothetical protein